ncbi:MAG TPA: monodechloroaminopyrrolnitrin synthase PrnB family protein [Acidobacteriota bacterium]|nr:monodechloroaminopyrrolnitrin synthase PrnB family protein [Acidobacteriota bacterium]
MSYPEVVNKPAHRHFDNWIRTTFSALNTEIEEGEKRRREAGNPPGDAPDQQGIDRVRRRIRKDGRRHVLDVLNETPLLASFEERLEVLGNVGMLIASCTRHGLNEPAQGQSPLVEESRLALQLGASLGVAPRLILAPYATHNKARRGVFKSFTRYEDERTFIYYNTQGIFEYERASEALEKICALGISNPIALEFFAEAEAALSKAHEINDKLYESIDVDTFFYGIRPYYKTSIVGNRSYRGVNAGDFAGINQIDLLLGLCSADDPFYLNLLVEKTPFVLPHEQEALRRCMIQRSLLDEFLEAGLESSQDEWFQKGARAFLKVCQAHGRAAAAHHNKLVKKFIERPAEGLDKEELDDLTASGPPLPALLNMLEKLRDLRLGKQRSDIRSRHGDLELLKSKLYDPVA